ncbi:hypothetical protein ACN38_g8429 [Penicillium nordicum]|uniref:Uncharacterized protein n=1 Tax=Penicillium nordicum TaxID=229535 RepID=A0A0N0RYA6_9EURO|nr:hypothetical protein ACN38_g8429 [Penicillium nordicum]
MLDSLIQALQTVIAALTTGITRPLKPLVIFTGQSSRARSVMLPTEGSIEAWEERRNGLGAGGNQNPPRPRKLKLLIHNRRGLLDEVNNPHPTTCHSSSIPIP